MNEKTIADKLILNGIPFSDDLPEKLYTYLEMLREWNQKMDLTAVSEDEETVDKHFIDSLTVLRYGIIRENTSLIDVGTGAGFPGMVLAMTMPSIQVTLLDSQQKRLSFLDALADRTGVQNVKTVHARAEDGARKAELRERFDYAVSRAVAPLNVLCEYMLPYVKIKGYALCWKGPALKDEMAQGGKAVRLLGGRMEMPVSCPVEDRDWNHMILPVQKVQATPVQYPRKAGTPKDKPLGI